MATSMATTRAEQISRQETEWPRFRLRLDATSGPNDQIRSRAPSGDNVLRYQDLASLTPLGPEEVPTRVQQISVDPAARLHE
jgi:hypothetical protein